MIASELHELWRGLPVQALGAAGLGGNLLVLAPHADDESLGCGGLIASLSQRGQPPGLLFVTDSSLSHPGSALWPPARLAARREDEAIEAAGCLGLRVGDVGFLRLPDSGVPLAGPMFEAGCTAIARAARHRGCDTLLAPWVGDPHCDHEATFHMAYRVARDLDLRLLAMPIWGWTLDGSQPVPAPAVTRGFRLDIEAQLDRKRRAIALHVSQHGGLIDDDPQGFVLPPGLLATFEAPTETYLEVA